MSVAETQSLDYKILTPKWLSLNQVVFEKEADGNGLSSNSNFTKRENKPVVAGV